YVDRAEGALKWDVDGHRYIDYWMGHGALLFGHNPPAVRDAVREQASKGTHYGACHAGEVEWGEWVCRLVPSAQRVRFTASGTEATHMAVRLEPTGGHFGSVPPPAAFVHALRDETRRTGALLIFDEVVTGFRVAPGGAQELLGVTPDLTTLAKILAGGLPGGAVAGREDVLAYLATKPNAKKIAHHGTFNANPLTAAAGVAMLAAVADGQAIRVANAQAAKLRHGLNEILARENVGWKIYGEHSDWKIFFGAGAPPRDGADQSVADVDWRRLDAKDAER